VTDIAAQNARTRRDTAFAMRLSLIFGVLMLAGKSAAYLMTGSAAILSDAAESVIHVVAVAFAAFSLRMSTRPADARFHYGYERIAFFSAGFEGAMIILAAIYIIYQAIEKWLSGLYLENLGTGAVFTTIATLINGGLGWYLVHQGKKYHSIVLDANGKHVLTDSWTSLGVILALVLTMITGWLPFDPILAIIVALNILWTGGKLIRRSIGGLMDESDPRVDAILKALLQRETEKRGMAFHHLRHRNAGNKLLIEFHLLFHENVTVATAHEQATLIEKEIHRAFTYNIEVISHLEPIEGHDEVHEHLLPGSQK
jgi:cation diffusion facilitator family transporter